MSPHTAFSRPRVLIFDTGPLRELLTYSAVRDLRFEVLRNDLRYLRADSSYKKFTQFIASFATKTTTAHVVAEISAWILRTPPEGRSAMWGLVYQEFRAMDEHLVKLLDMPHELVADMGATDVSVLNLALRYARSQSVVISIEQKLVAECNNAGVLAKSLWEVIS